MSDYGYKPGNCQSLVTPLNEGEALGRIAAFKNAKAVAWYFDAIAFYSIDDAGKWHNSNYRDNLKEELVRLRIFDENKELHIWRSNGQLKGRLREDNEGDKTDFADATLLLNGTRIDKSGDTLVLTEEKGIHYELPLYDELKDAGKDDRIGLKTRNYIGHNNEIGQAGYEDCRFVDFEIFKK